MRIDRTGRRPAPGALRRKLMGSAFVAPADAHAAAAAPDPTQQAAAVPPAGLPPRDTAETAPRPPDQACAAHGRAVLGALAGLQLATLGGDGGHARQTLAELARALPAATDPGLDAVLQAIAQRAAIELARAG